MAKISKMRQLMELRDLKQASCLHDWQVWRFDPSKRRCTLCKLTRPRNEPGGRKCMPKKCYPSKEVAIVAALRNSGSLGKPMRAYLCDKCPWWHLTTQTIETYRENHA